jgi:adenine nucleotide transporter 17
MQAQIIKAVLAQALLFGLKDALEGYTVRLLAYIAAVKMNNRRVA